MTDRYRYTVRPAGQQAAWATAPTLEAARILKAEAEDAGLRRVQIIDEETGEAVSLHREECRCPVCAARAAGPGAPTRTVRLSGETWQWLLSRPEGARSWIEGRVREAQEIVLGSRNQA